LLAQGPAPTLLSPIVDQEAHSGPGIGADPQDGMREVLIQAILDPAYQLK
jgi:hypothetical protein